MAEGQEEVDAAIRRHLEMIGAAIQADAQATCPKDTGALAASIEHEVQGRTVRIGSNLRYAAAVELGSAPHIIRARNARTLANRETGQVFGPVVHHPGTPAQPYLAPALHRVRGRLG